MLKPIYILTLLFFISCSALVAQPFAAAKIKRLSIENGLSNRFVNRAFQDSKGFIWLATKYGLNRYDGYSFELFSKDNQRLSGNMIHSVYEDSDTCLWVAYSTVDGKLLGYVDVLNLNTYDITPLKPNKDALFKEGDIIDIFQAGFQTIFVLTKDKIVYQYNGRGVFQKIFELPYPAYTLNDILVSPESIWVGGQGYLLEYNRSGKFVKEEIVPFKSVLDMRLEKGGLAGYARSLNDSLMVFSRKLGQNIDYQTLPLFSQDIKALSVFSKIKQAPNGLIWYSDGEVSKMYNSKGELVYDFSSHLLDRSVHWIADVFFDNNHGAWIATTNGLYVLTIQPNLFQSYLSKNEFVPNSVAHSIRGIIEDDDGYLIVNTYSGRKKIHPETGKIILLESENSKKALLELDVLKDRAGNIWFCGTRNVIECYNPKLKTTKLLPCKIFERGDKSSDYEIMNIKLFQDSYGRIWVGSNDGVYYLDSLHKAFIKHNAYSDCIELNNSRVYDFLEDTVSKVLWAGTSTGIYKYEYSEGHFTHRYATDEKAPYYIPHASILCMHKDLKEDFYWLGTYEGGLIKWNYKEGKSEQFTVADGFSDNVIYSILEDYRGVLWMGSNYGLMQFDKKTHWVKIYLPKDGTGTEEFNVLSSYQSKSGRFYFGGINGMIGFYPQDFKNEGNTKIPIHVVNYKYLKANSQDLEDRTKLYYQQKTIVLEPNDNFFMITFSLLDYTDPSKNRYAYKIDGLVQDWQYTNENVLRFNRLPYGTYILKIKAQGYDGRWSSNELSIPIEIQVPVYQTWGFLILLVFLIGVVVLFGVWVLIRQNAVSKKRLEKQVSSRTQMLLEREQDLVKAKEDAEKSSQAKAEFLSVMSHEIRTPMNAVVNLTNYLLEDNPSSSQVENLNILKFSANNLLAIINDVLDFSKIESGRVDFERIDFDFLALLENMHYIMATNAKAKGIHFFLDAEINLTQMLVGDPNRLIQILNNLISNAIKFTEKGHVKLRLTVLNETDEQIKLLFEIEDTGIGIAQEESEYIFKMFTQAASHTTRKYGGTGLGLAITKRLLQLQNSDVQLRSKVGEGSIFSFALTFEKGRTLADKRLPKEEQKDMSEQLKGFKILVVEDNTVNVLVVKKFLKKWGIEIVHAVDGQDAVEKVQQEVFDLILMDIHMPVMDGYMASQCIRNMDSEYYKQVPIIALTASALIDNKDRVYKVGMNDIVVKPFKPDELYNILLKYLQKSY